MAYLGSWKIDDYLSFYCNTHTASTGAGTDADSVPTYRIYEDETGTAIANGSMALLDSTNTVGFYSEQVQLTTATGYEKGKQYVIYITATVATVAGTMHHTFQMEAEVDANTVSPTVVAANVTQWLGQAAAAVTQNGVPEVDITHIGGVAVSTSTAQLGVNVVNAAGTAWGSGAITAASVATDAGTEIASAVWDLDATAHQTAGTFGKAIGDPLARTNSLMQSIPDAVAGAAGGLFIAGTNAATTITTSLTTTFTGNLTGSVASVTGSVGSVTGLTASNLDATITSRLAPTVAGRTLDVTATGEAGIDWANIGGPTTSQTLSGTTVGTATAVTTVNGLAADVLTAAATAADFGTEVANAVWALDATGQQTQGTFGQAVGDPTTGTSLIARLPNASPGAAGGVFIAGTNAATTVTTALTTTFTGNLTGSVGSVTGAVGSVTGAVGSVTGAVGSVTGLTAANLDATVSSRATQTSVDTVDDFLDTEIADIQGRLPAALVSGRMDASLSAAGLAADAVDEILDEVIEGSYTLRQMVRLFASALASKLSGAAGTTITIRDIGDTKDRIVATVDSSGNRTAVTLDVS